MQSGRLVQQALIHNKEQDLCADNNNIGRRNWKVQWTFPKKCLSISVNKLHILAFGSNTTQRSDNGPTLGASGLAKHPWKRLWKLTWAFAYSARKVRIKNRLFCHFFHILQMLTRKNLCFEYEISLVHLQELVVASFRVNNTVLGYKTCFLQSNHFIADWETRRSPASFKIHHRRPS